MTVKTIFLIRIRRVTLRRPRSNKTDLTDSNLLQLNNFLTTVFQQTFNSSNCLDFKDSADALPDAQTTVSKLNWPSFPALLQSWLAWSSETKPLRKNLEHFQRPDSQAVASNSAWDTTDVIDCTISTWHTHRHTHTTVLWLYRFCLGQPGWAGTIHPLTLIVVINHPYLLPPFPTIHDIHPVQSTHLTVFFHNLSTFSLVYLLAWLPLLHTLYNIHMTSHKISPLAYCT